MTDFSIPPTSRYYGVDTATLVDSDGEQVPYLRRRLLPASNRFVVLHAHVVISGERVDHIAARELGDAELSWRVCDANDAMHPSELVATNGRRLRITLPEGIPGPVAG